MLSSRETGISVFIPFYGKLGCFFPKAEFYKIYKNAEMQDGTGLQLLAPILYPHLQGNFVSPHPEPHRNENICFPALPDAVLVQRTSTEKLPFRGV
jgi:hypothetical protein